MNNDLVNLKHKNGYFHFNNIHQIETGGWEEVANGINIDSAAIFVITLYEETSHSSEPLPIEEIRLIYKLIME